MSEPRIAQEPDALEGQRIAIVGIVAVATIASSLFATWWLMRLATRDRPAPPPSAVVERVGPLDAGAIDEQRRGVHANEAAAAALDEWRWVDREHGVARIPIDAAMRALVEEQQR